MALKDIKAANNAKSELAQAISPTDTSFIVNDASVFPDAPFRITIDKEIMEVGTINKSRNTFSDITRGVEGTTATNHDKGASVENRWTAGTLQILLDNIKTTFTQVVNGKKQIAAAISDMNQSVASDADFARMAAKIRDISKDATATPGYVARGKTFYAGGRKQTGTYHLDAKPWRLITPTTHRINISGGYYPDGLTVEGDSNLKSSNILKGKSIFGVRGDIDPGKFVQDVVTIKRDRTNIYVGFRPDIVVLNYLFYTNEEYHTIIAADSIYCSSGGTYVNCVCISHKYKNTLSEVITSSCEFTETGVIIDTSFMPGGTYAMRAWKKGNM